MDALKKKLTIKGRDGVGDSIAQVLIYVLVGSCALITVLPFLYVVAGSFATEKELTERAFFIIPHEFSLNAYKYILGSGEVANGLKNSAYVTIVGTFVNMVFTTTFAYAVSRQKFRYRTFALNLVIVTMLFSGGMIPNYLLISKLGYLNSFSALIIPGAINAFNLIIVKNFFQEFPQELEEAARIDGCNDIQIFYRIVLPLSKAVIASISLFYAVGHWNDYFGPMLYITDSSKEVIQITLRRIIFLAGGIDPSGQAIDYGIMGEPPEKAVKMATTVVATLPILIVYPFVQKYFTKGVMIGAVKG